MQIDNAVIDRITKNVLGVFDKAGETRAEIDRKIHDVVLEGIEHFELVVREEFDVATRLLANTRIKVETLEKQVAALEKTLEEKAKPAAKKPAAKSKAAKK